MQTCKTCKHWTDHSLGFGQCHKIPDFDKIDIEVKAGWSGGYVDKVETAEDFGCTLHEIKPIEL